MKHYVKPSLLKRPERLIIHVGTTDFEHSSPGQIPTSIATLVQEIQEKAPTKNSAISELIARNDNPEFMATIQDSNSRVSQVCKNYNWEIITNGHIVGKHLNSCGVHQNKQGNASLAKNTCDFH